MALKDEWKSTGKRLGQAFKGLGKSVVRSVKTGVDAVDDSMENNEGNQTDGNNSNVFNDGTWRKTGKDLGSAFVGVARSIVSSAKTGIDKLDDSDTPADNDNK